MKAAIPKHLFFVGNSNFSSFLDGPMVKKKTIVENLKQILTDFKT